LGGMADQPPVRPADSSAAPMDVDDPAPPAAPVAAVAPAAADEDGHMAAEVPNPADPRDTDLGYFHHWAQPEHFEELPPGRFTKNKKLADAIYGTVELHEDHVETMLDGSPGRVVMKKMKTDKVEKTRMRASYNDRDGAREEDALTEIGVLRCLGRPMCAYILRSLGCFRDVVNTMLITEYRGKELFSVIENSPERWKEVDVLHHVCQVLIGLQYLHERNIAHLDVSLENLLYEAENRQVVIMDFGLAALCATKDGRDFRYFRKIGKPYYCSPEMYSPKSRYEEVTVVRPPGVAGGIGQLDPGKNGGYMFEVHLPDSPPEERCRAQMAGYRARPSDIFAVGVCMFILHASTPPWQRAFCQEKSFNFVRVKGIAELLKAWGIRLSDPAEQLMEALLRVDPVVRPTVLEALTHPGLSIAYAALTAPAAAAVAAPAAALAA